MLDSAETTHVTGNAEAVLHEAATALARFAEDGTEHAIDLKSLPMSARDIEILEEVLGVGEVRVRVEVAGESEIWETLYPGLWWVRHRGADRRVVTELLEVTHIPRVLMTHRDDVRGSAMRLQRALRERNSNRGMNHGQQ